MISIRYYDDNRDQQIIRCDHMEFNSLKNKIYTELGYLCPIDHIISVYSYNGPETIEQAKGRDAV